MNPRINKMLTEIRHRLVEVDVEPDIAAVAAEPGDLGATNMSDTADAIVNYVEEIVDALTRDYEISTDEALEFVFEVAKVFVGEGVLPPIPDLSDPEVLQAEWLGVAKSIGFKSEVCQAAEEVAVD